MRDAQLLRIPCHVAVVHVVLHHQLVEASENLLAFRDGYRLFSAVTLIDDGDALVDVGIEVGRDVLFYLVGKVLVHADQETQVLFHEPGAFGAQLEHGASHREIDGVEYGVRLAALLDEFRREAQKIDVEIPLDTVYLEDASRGECHEVVLSHRDVVQVDRRFHRPFQAEHENLASQPHGIVGVQAQQVLVDVRPDDPVFRQVDFRQFLFHRVLLNCLLSCKYTIFLDSVTTEGVESHKDFIHHSSLFTLHSSRLNRWPYFIQLLHGMNMT